MKGNNLTKTIIGLVIAGVVVVIVVLLPKKSTSAQDAIQLPTSVPVTQETSGSSAVGAIPSTSRYRDGTYSATGSHLSPGGEDDVHVTVTLANGIITDSTVTNGAHDKTSSYFQGIFINNYKPLVIGKSIDSVSLSKVSGSSLTSEGFNNALAKIKTLASA